MILSDYDHALLSGAHGPAARMAMSIITRMAEIQGARELLDISQAHIDSTIYMGEAGLEIIKGWSFKEDIEALTNALETLTGKRLA